MLELGLLVGALGIATAVLLGRIFVVRRHAPRELARRLAPHMHLRHPPGDGPFPTVVGFHGCAGVCLGELDWMEHLCEQGFAAVLVDSNTPRALRRGEVCRGLRLWGTERAGDVVAALEHVRTLPFVNADRLALAGWSHGAWAVMDGLALDSLRRLPWNLSSAPKAPFAGVRALVLFYPYSGLPTVARRRGWRQRIPALMLLAGNDPLLPGARRTALRLHGHGVPLASHVFEGADHAFDMRDEDLEGYPVQRHPAALADARERVTAFLDQPLRGGLSEAPGPGSPGCRRAAPRGH